MASFSGTLDSGLCHLKATEDLFFSMVIKRCVSVVAIQGDRAIGRFKSADEFRFWQRCRLSTKEHNHVTRVRSLQFKSIERMDVM